MNNTHTLPIIDESDFEEHMIPLVAMNDRIAKVGTINADEIKMSISTLDVVAKDAFFELGAHADEPELIPPTWGDLRAETQEPELELRVFRRTTNHYRQQLAASVLIHLHVIVRDWRQIKATDPRLLCEMQREMLMLICARLGAMLDGSGHE